MSEVVANEGSRRQMGRLWQGAKRDIQFLPQHVEGILRYAKSMIDDDMRDHPTRVYVEKPSERFLALMTPVLGLTRIEWGCGLVQWQVALSEETDKIDPVAARNVNNFIAQRLQEFFWKKDATFLVDSARTKPASNLIAVEFRRERSN